MAAALGGGGITLLLEALPAGPDGAQLLAELEADPACGEVRVVGAGPEAANAALAGARGEHVCWLAAGHRPLPGALARAAEALNRHPGWMVLYGEAERLDPATGLRQRLATFPPPLSPEAWAAELPFCPSTLVFRRQQVLELGGFAGRWPRWFVADLALRLAGLQGEAIGYVPHRQVELAWEEVGSADRRAGALLELLALLHRHGGGTAAGERLQRFALDLQGGLEPLPPGVALADHLEAVLRRAEAWMEAKTLQGLRHDWLLDPATAPVQIATEHHMAGLQLNDRLPLRLLQAFDPGLRLSRPSPPAGPHLRLQLGARHYRRLFPLLRRSPPPLTATVPFAERPFGVNLVGHAFDVFGIGEDIRMAARALQAAAIPCCVIDVPAGPEVERGDRRLEPLLCREPQAEWLGGPYAFNLVCMAAEIQARWLLQSGLAPLLERYTLAAWPWETDQWPEGWLPLLEVADELWPASRFTAAAQQPAAAAAGLPVTLMPMAAELEQPERFRSPEARRQARQRHGLPLEAVLFAAAFDHNSTALRKNPIGALEAFQRAFPVGAGGLSDQVALVIKTFPPKRPGGEWRWLQARAAEDPRIHLVVACLEREELLALYGCCDAFVSLHRSEGFGRNLAEALQLGLEVVATDYSGNTDFCLGPQAWPVGWRRVPVPPGGYPNADGHHWAEPDGDHAAELLRQVAIQRLADGVLPHPRALETGEQVGEPFSFRSTGERYRRRLEELWAQRQAIGPQLRWRQAGLG